MSMLRVVRFGRRKGPRERIVPDAGSKHGHLHIRTWTGIRMMHRAGQGSTEGTAEITRLVEEHFPQVHEGTGRLTIERTGDMGARVRMAFDARIIRPGGTVSGPAMFKLADFAVYVAILGERGATALQAVTSNLNITFLTRPAPGDMVAEVRLIRLGRRLAVALVELYSDGHAEMVAHATATYALPAMSQVK
jgi:uncharacterized protein (TIGR00369 family)